MANYCDDCGKDPVTHEAFKDPVTGEFIEHHFCADCPKAQGLIGHPTPPLAPGAPPHAVPAVVRVSAAGLGPCPSCGVTFSRFRETGRLGCPSCYEHFEQVLGPMIARAQEGAAHHVGKLPKRALSRAGGETGTRSLEEVLGQAEERARKVASLRSQLRSALSSERYEQAALIRDQIEQFQSMFGLPPGDEAAPQDNQA